MMMRKSVMNWMQPPFPISLCHSGGESREIGSEAEPGKKEEIEGRFLKFFFPIILFFY